MSIDEEWHTFGRQLSWNTRLADHVYLNLLAGPPRVTCITCQVSNPLPYSARSNAGHATLPPVLAQFEADHTACKTPQPQETIRCL